VRRWVVAGALGAAVEACSRAMAGRIWGSETGATVEVNQGWDRMSAAVMRLEGSTFSIWLTRSRASAETPQPAGAPQVNVPAGDGLVEARLVVVGGPEEGDSSP